MHQLIKIVVISCLSFWTNMVIAESTVDISVKKYQFLGLTLNEPITGKYPVCKGRPEFDKYVEITCLWVNKYAKLILPKWDYSNDKIKEGWLFFAKKDLPSYARFGSADVVVDEEDKLIYIAIRTRGMDYQSQLMKLLIDEFGEPTDFSVIDKNTPPQIMGLYGSYRALWYTEDIWIRYIGEFGPYTGALGIGLQRLYINGRPHDDF